MKFLRRIPIAAGLIATARACQGCANFISIDMHDDSARVSEQLHADNRIRVHDASGKPHTLEVGDVRSDQIVARDRSGAELHIEYKEAKVERREFAPGKTAALAASVVVGLYALGYAAAEGAGAGAVLEGG